MSSDTSTTSSETILFEEPTRIVYLESDDASRPIRTAVVLKKLMIRTDSNDTTHPIIFHGYFDALKRHNNKIYNLRNRGILPKQNTQ